MGQETIRKVAAVVIAVFLIACAAAVALKANMDQTETPASQEEQSEAYSGESAADRPETAEETQDDTDASGMEELPLSDAMWYLNSFDWTDYESDCSLHFTNLRIDDMDESNPKDVRKVKYGYQLRDAHATRDRSTVAITIYRFPYDQGICDPDNDDVVSLKITAAPKSIQEKQGSFYQMEVDTGSAAPFTSSSYYSVAERG